MSLRFFFIFAVSVFFRASVFSQNGSLATSYTLDACGLDFVQGSVRLNQRPFGFSPSTGASQPASINITGIPNCATILKAFLYVGTSGNGVAITASITNPALTTAAFPMTVAGNDIDVCWLFAGTYTYRADVTSIVSGNGTYTLSGIPTSAAASLNSNDADGATLFIIYQDPFQSYTGSIILADGCHAVTPSGPQYASNTITGFSVCATPTLTQNFMIIADLQQLGNTIINFNTAINSSTTPNYNKTPASDQVWDFINAPVGPAFAGQTSANYGMYNYAGDCVSMVLVGMYYRTNCLGCVASPINTVITLNAVSTPSCQSSATVNVSGGLAPYSYVWTGTNQTASVVTGLSAGMYTVNVSGFGGCGTGSVTIEVLTLLPLAFASSATVCPGQSAILNASGGSSFSWNGPLGFASSAQSITVTAGTSTGTTVYNVLVTSPASCTGTATGILTTVDNPNVQIIATKTLICLGGTSTLTPSGAQTYTWLASSLSQTQPIVVTPTASTIYSLQGMDANGCMNATTLLVNVSECTGMDEVSIHGIKVMVSPNPSSGSFTVSTLQNVKLLLVNALGQRIETIELSAENHHQQRIYDLDIGVYYIVPIENRSLAPQKIVVEE